MAGTGFEPPTLSLVDRDLSNWATRSVVLHTMTTVWLLHEKLLRLISFS